MFVEGMDGYLYFVSSAPDEIPPFDPRAAAEGYYFFWNQTSTWVPPAQWTFQSEVDEKEFDLKRSKRDQDVDDRQTKRARRERS